MFFVCYLVLGFRVSGLVPNHALADQKELRRLQEVGLVASRPWHKRGS